MIVRSSGIPTDRFDRRVESIDNRTAFCASASDVAGVTTRSRIGCGNCTASRHYLLRSPFFRAWQILIVRDLVQWREDTPAQDQALLVRRLHRPTPRALRAARPCPPGAPPAVSFRASGSTRGHGPFGPQISALRVTIFPRFPRPFARPDLTTSRLAILRCGMARPARRLQGPAPSPWPGRAGKLWPEKVSRSPRGRGDHTGGGFGQAERRPHPWARSRKRAPSI